MACELFSLCKRFIFLVQKNPGHYLVMLASIDRGQTLSPLGLDQPCTSPNRQLQPNQEALAPMMPLSVAV